MITGAIGLRYVNVILRFPVAGPIYVDEDSWILDWTTAIMIDVRAICAYCQMRRLTIAMSAAQDAYRDTESFYGRRLSNLMFESRCLSLIELA